MALTNLSTARIEHGFESAGQFPPGRWCIGCHRYQHEPPTKLCKNPSWHDLPLEADEDGPFEAVD